MNLVGVNMRRLLMVLMAATLLFGLTAAVATHSASAAFPGGTGWIAFSGTDDAGTGDTEIYVMNPGTGDVFNVTDNLFLEADPAFSADGKMLAYAGTDLVSSSAIYVASFDPSGPSLGTPTKISTGPIDGSPTWSPDGTMVAYQRRIITTMSTGSATADDATGTLLTDDPAGDFVNEGVEVGDTVKNLTDGSQGIVTARTATTVSMTALSGGTDDQWAIGDNYTIERSHRQIFKSPSDGSNLTGTLLSTPGSELLHDDQEPVWSPDGSLIAFTSTDDDSNSDIFTMSATDGSSRTNLTDNLTFDNAVSHPNWSPDGQSIALQTAEPNVAHHNVWTISKTGTNPDQVTGVASTGTDNDLEPAWSPDGEQIVFRRGDSGGNKVYVINSDGSGAATRIGSSSAPTANVKPDWQPVLTGVDDAYDVDEGDSLSVLVGDGVLVNDLALLSNIGTLSATSFTDPAHGVLTPSADGSFVYVHDGSETTSDTFTYMPVQGSVTGTMATVTITINPIDDPVDPDSPTVAIAGPSFGQIGEVATFTSTITDGSGPVAYTWTVTRGGTQVGTGTSAALNFTPTSSGVFEVELVVVDDIGTDTAAFKFTVMTDIAGSVFASDIVWLANEGITRGCNPPVNDQFCPNDTVTRGQMAAFMVRFLGLTDIDPAIEFTDTGSSIFEQDILRLATAGITRGCNPPTNDQYCPNDSVTRGQMAAFLVRALDLTDNGGGDLFTDDDDSIFEDDIDKLATAGITRGCNPPANTNFCPSDTVTRGQMAAFLHRADPLK